MKLKAEIAFVKTTDRQESLLIRQFNGNICYVANKSGEYLTQELPKPYPMPKEALDNFLNVFNKYNASKNIIIKSFTICEA